MTNTWLISDTHFDHANIIKYCNRPFLSVEDMNETILKNWHEAVGSHDLVYLLGDIAFGKDSRSAQWWLKQLTGQILLVHGSHDNGLRAPYYRIIHAGNIDILLLHNPADVPEWWTGWVIHGHTHNSTPFINHIMKRVNVSAEAIGYKPMNLANIVRLIKKEKTEHENQAKVS